jgi:hypothetical protein
MSNRYSQKESGIGLNKHSSIILTAMLGHPKHNLKQHQQATTKAM